MRSGERARAGTEKRRELKHGRSVTNMGANDYARPHGILSLGAFLNFGSEATGFSQKFPGIDLRILTLTSNFRIPFYGLLLSMMGIADASRESCNNCLQRAPGSAILLVLGGAKESLDSHA